MKILHIDTGMVWRGGQRQVLTLHRGLLQRDIESILLCNRQGKLHEKCAEEKINSFDGFDFLGELSRETRHQIEQLINTHQPDLIHCHDSHAVTLGTRYHKQLPIFHTRRVSYPIKWLSRLFKYRKVGLHICVSEDIRRYMSQFFEHTTTIHSCVDLNRFQIPVDHTAFEKAGKFNILYVGAFTEQKGIDILLNAFSLIHSKHPDAVLHLIGDGHLYPEVESLISKLTIEDCTVLYGARSDVEPFYLSSDLVICPSVSGEGSSGVVKEGLAAGKLVIASNLEANKELIDNHANGLLFENRNSEHLAQLIDESINQQHKLSKQAIYDKVTAFDCKQTVAQHIKLYQQAILQ